MSDARKPKLVETLLKMTKEWMAYEMTVGRAIDLLKVRYGHTIDIRLSEMEREYGFNKFIQLIVDKYVDYYSEKELDELIAFYSSPLGKKMFAKEFLSDLQKITLMWVTELETKCHDTIKGVKQ